MAHDGALLAVERLTAGQEQPLPHDATATTPSNLTCYVDGSVFCWLPARRQLKATFLRVTSAKHRVQHLQLDHPPHEAVTAVLANSVGTHLALVGPNTITVLRVPERRGPDSSFGDGSAEVVTESHHVGQYYTASTVVDVKWHPLSPQHIVALTVDGYLRVFCIQEPDTPELALRVSDDALNLSTASVGGQVAVSFDFGGRHLWDWFAVYVLQECGDILCFCPIVPKHSVVPVELAAELRADCRTPEEVAWVDQVLSGPRPPDGISALATSDQGISVSPPAKASPARMQGPFRMYPPDPEHNYGFSGCQLLVIPNVPTVLVAADSSGYAFLSVILDPTRPAWESTPTPSEPQHLYILEQVDLEFPRELGAIHVQRDPQCPDRFFLYHGRGLHSVRVSWLQDLSQYCLNVEEDNVAVPSLDLFASWVQNLLQTVRLDAEPGAVAPVLGLFVVTDPALGYSVVALTQECKVLSFPLSATRVQSLPDDAGGFTEPGVEAASFAEFLKGGVSFESQIESILAKAKPAPMLSTKGSSEQDLLECHKKLVDTIQTIRDNQLVALRRAQEEIRGRLRLQAEIAQVQKDQLADLESRANDARAIRDLLADKAYQFGLSLETLLQRASIVVTELDSQLPVLSDAETAYQKTLVQTGKKARILDSKISELKRRFLVMEPALVAQGTQKVESGLSAQQQQVFQDVLENSNKSIDQLCHSVRSLQERLDAV